MPASPISKRLRLAVFAYLGICFAGPAAAVEIQAPAGTLIGTQEEGFRLFQGIPYAEAPTGERRWAPPVAKAALAEPFQATEAGAECPQFATFWRPGKAASWNEDCLSLTVYAPDGEGANRAVMVGYHGGGSRNGAKTDWDPRELAREGNVVVTVNYRLGALGFLASEELNAESADGGSSGNYGDLDRIEALRWVKANIAAFGGDPGRVTVAGQSAGARGVCFILASPDAAGLFQGAVIESGAGCASVPNAQAARTGASFAEAMGCGEEATRLACLRAKSPAEILAVQEGTKMPLPLVHGGRSMPVTPLEAYGSGAFNRVPVIVGNTRNEIRVFVYEANDLVRQPVTQRQYEEAIRARMGERAEAVLAAFRATAEIHPGLALGDIDAAERYLCTTPEVMDALARWTPTYAYEFGDETAPIRPYANVPPSFPLGVPHSAELPYVWGEDTVPNGLTAEQQQLAQTMRGFWTSLAAPDGPVSAGGPDWPAYKPDTRQRIVFEAGGQTRLVDQDSYLAGKHCELLAR